MGAQPAARGPHAAREAPGSGPRPTHKNKKNKNFIEGTFSILFIFLLYWKTSSVIGPMAQLQVGGRWPSCHWSKGPGALEKSPGKGQNRKIFAAFGRKRVNFKKIRGLNARKRIKKVTTF